MKSIKTGLSFVLYLMFSCTSTSSSKKYIYNNNRINGLTFVAPPKPYDSFAFSNIKRIGANWVSVIPYAYHKNDNPNVQYNLDWQWWGETKEGVEKTINDAKRNGLNVMLKPQVYIPLSFTGNMNWLSEKDWETWESSYRQYILDYAKIAEQTNVQIFCIGTEYKNAVIKRPEFWFNLIIDIKKAFSGKLTYASN